MRVLPLLPRPLPPCCRRRHPAATVARCCTLPAPNRFRTLPPLVQQAAKLAEAVLKKYKGDQLVRALKAYALHRSGKPEEALQVGRPSPALVSAGHAGCPAGQVSAHCMARQ